MQSLDSKFLYSELQMQYEQTWIEPVTHKKIFEHSLLTEAWGDMPPLSCTMPRIWLRFRKMTAKY